MLASTVCAGEQNVFSSKSNRAHGSFDSVGIQLQATVIQEQDQSPPKTRSPSRRVGVKVTWHLPTGCASSCRSARFIPGRILARFRRDFRGLDIPGSKGNSGDGWRATGRLSRGVLWLYAGKPSTAGDRTYTVRQLLDSGSEEGLRPTIQIAIAPRWTGSGHTGARRMTCHRPGSCPDYVRGCARMQH